MQSQSLNLKYKGERTYLHGSDIYNAVDQIVRMNDDECYVSHIAFRQFARRDCVLSWTAPGDRKNLIAKGGISHSGIDKPFWIIESDRPANGRYDFDEASLVAPAIREHEEIFLKKRSIYTPIEEIIALTKRLNYELMPDIDGQWLFGQLDMNCALPKDYSSLIIRRVSQVAGRFSLNNITMDKCDVGKIRFIVGAP